MKREIDPGYHRAVAAELDRHKRLGYTPEHDDRMGLDHLLEHAFYYAAIGSTVRAGAMIIAARTFLQRNTKNPMQTAIEDFMRRCDQEVKAYPDLPEEEIVTLRIRLMVEELMGAVTPDEFWDKSTNESVKFGADRYIHLLIENKSDELIASMLKGDLVGIADGIADVLYVVIGTSAAYGIDIQEVFDEVHRSNLSKSVWSEEQQRYLVQKDQYGKLIKTDTYSPADIEPIIQRQIDNGKAWENFYSDQASDAEMVVGTIEG